jgi:ribosomal protein S27AE
MTKKASTFIIDREKLNTLNDEGCPACGKKFSLGDTAVVACGAWGNTMKVIHENEAVFDPNSGGYVERRCFHARRGAI